MVYIAATTYPCCLGKKALKKQVLFVAYVYGLIKFSVNCAACHAACLSSCSDGTASTCDTCSDGWQPDGFGLLSQACKGENCHMTNYELLC